MSCHRKNCQSVQASNTSVRNMKIYWLLARLCCDCRMIVTIQNQDNTSLYCAELHSPYENVVAAGQNPSP